MTQATYNANPGTLAENEAAALLLDNKRRLVVTNAASTSGLTGSQQSVSNVQNVLSELEYRLNPSVLVDRNYRNALSNNIGAQLVDPGVLTALITDTTYTIDNVTGAVLTLPVGCSVNPDFINTGATIIYITAVYGTGTASAANIPIAAGGSYRFPAVPAGQTIYAFSSANGGKLLVVTGV